MALTRRQWFRRAAAISGMAAAGAAGYATLFEPHWIETNELSMPLANLPASLIGKRIVQVSDLHIGRVVDPTYMRRALRFAVQLNPDWLVITGDLMTCFGSEQVSSTVDMLRPLAKPGFPVVMIPGNHDYALGYQRGDVAGKLCNEAERIGLTVLRNATCTVDGLQVVGVDDLWAGQTNYRRALAEYDAALPSIMLNHNPDAVDLPGLQLFRGWILAGHTHGGQCSFPLVGAPVTPIRNKRYTAGKVVLDDWRTLYVNRGLGYKHRIRFGCRPEISVFTLCRQTG